MKYIFASVILMLSTVVNAAFIPFTHNPSETDAVAAYVGNFPTPFDKGSAPASGDVFNTNDDIRAAIMLDLQALDRATDELNGNDLLDVTIAWYFGGVYQTFNSLNYSWDQIALDQLAGLGGLAFWTDSHLKDNGFIADGEWAAAVWVEGSYYGADIFTVPEPSTWFMFALIAVFTTVAKRKTLFK